MPSSGRCVQACRGTGAPPGVGAGPVVGVMSTGDCGRCRMSSNHR